MYLILAIALWIYIACVYVRDKSYHQMSQQAHSEWFNKAKKEHDSFRELYTVPDELLSQTQHLVYSNSNEALAMRNRIQSEAGITPTSDMTIRALLARDCKLLRTSAYSGFNAIPRGRVNAEIERKFLMWYDKELRIHGFPYKLLFLPWYNESKFPRDITGVVPVSECPEITSGKYFWAPNRAFLSSGDVLVTQENNRVR